MYEVSNDYRAAMNSPVMEWTIRGTVKRPSGSGEISITSSNILAGSLNITRQCSEGDEVKIGSVYISQLKCQFIGVSISRNDWENRIISLEEGLLIDPENGVYEYVPLGNYIVSEAIYTGHTVSVTAYDYMSKFDKNYPGTILIGNAFSMLEVACNECGVTNGMTAAEMSQLPNGQSSLAIFSANDIQTYRDLVFWIAQTLGTFAYITRDGKLRLKAYTSTVTDEIDSYHRHDGARFSDFITRYTGVSVVNVTDQKTLYVSLETDDGLTYNLGSNPLMQYGTESTRKQMLRNILTALQAIQYMPFEAKRAPAAAYDLGDVIRCKDGDGNNDIGCVMYSYWVYNQYSALKGFGSNPALVSAASKTDKNLAGLLSQISNAEIQIYTYMNAESITIEDTESERIIGIRFLTTTSQLVTFQAEVLLEAETESKVKGNITYKLNDVIRSYRPIETWDAGRHILSLYYVMPVDVNMVYQLDVFLEAEDGNFVIDAENARASVWGQGLVSTQAWGGEIDVEDTITAIPINDSISIAEFTEEIDIDVITPATAEGEDTLSAIPIDDGIEIAEFNDNVFVNKTSLFYDGYTWEDLYDMDWGEVLDNHVW